MLLCLLHQLWSPLYESTKISHKICFLQWAAESSNVLCTKISVSKKNNRCNGITFHGREGCKQGTTCCLSRIGWFRPAPKVIKHKLSVALSINEKFHVARINEKFHAARINEKFHVARISLSYLWHMRQLFGPNLAMSFSHIFVNCCPQNSSSDLSCDIPYTVHTQNYKFRKNNRIINYNVRI